MGIEIERKFLVVDSSWMQEADAGLFCKQGYLVSDKDKTVRIRIIGEKSFITIKGASKGISRSEFEYEIPMPEAHSILELCGDVVQKTRYLVKHKGMTWELDVFEGANEGLVIAEIELASEEQPFDLPDWAGEEVSGDIRYYNACLARKPFTLWK
jgi:CYTH domain-containing protein